MIIFVKSQAVNTWIDTQALADSNARTVPITRLNVLLQSSAQQLLISIRGYIFFDFVWLLVFHSDLDLIEPVFLTLALGISLDFHFKPISLLIFKVI